MSDDKKDKKKPYRPTFDPHKFKNKWEAKMTFMMLNSLADVEELKLRVEELEFACVELKIKYDKKNIH